MKQLLLSVAMLFIASITLIGQHPCATLGESSKWLRSFQQRLDQPNFQKNLDEQLYIPLTIYLLGTDEGKGYLSIPSLLDALCTLNADFEEWNIQFFIKGDIQYIANSDWYDHEDFDGGRPMINNNNVPNTINCFFVSNAADGCDYANLDSYYTVMSKGCSQAGDHTWAHEIGHSLSLNHTFFGWEAIGIRDSSSYNFNDPAPLTISYRQQDIPTELLDGSNCRGAADGFCDTDPDYLYNRWPCDANIRSRQRQTDPTGASFTSDGTLIMSYSNDNCSSRFSEEQALAMRANLAEQKNGLGKEPIDLELITPHEIAALIPENGELTPSENIVLEWTPVENATHYIIQLSRLPTFPFLDVNEVVEGNTITLESLEIDRRYYWRVRPFNYYATCTDFSDRFSFTTSEFTSTERTIEESIAITPNIAKTGEEVLIQFAEGIHHEVVVALIDLNGRTLDRRRFDYVNNVQVNYPIKAQQAGLYFLSLTIGKYHVVKKLVVQ